MLEKVNLIGHKDELLRREIISKINMKSIIKWNAKFKIRFK